MAVLYAFVRFTSWYQNNERHKISGFNLQSSVKSLKEKVGGELRLPPDEIELVCFGKRLKLEDSVESYGIKNGMTIHVIHREDTSPVAKPEAKVLSQVEIHQLVVALRSALVNPAFRTMINQLSKPDSMESIIAAVPGLADDPVAIAILQDPDLLNLLCDPIHIPRMVEMHPSLDEAVTHIAAAFHEEVSSQNNTLSAPSSSVSYSLDALSDDDEMEADSQGTSFAADGMLSPATITPAHLASALAAAAASNTQRDPFAASASQPPQSPLLQAPPPTPHPLITPEMFTQAMQHALGSVTQGNNQAQLQQLRDMGISDDAMSLRALEATDGDVQAALEFIFEELANRDSENVQDFSEN